MFHNELSGFFNPAHARTHTNKQTNTQTNTHTNRHTNTCVLVRVLDSCWVKYMTL
jgi:hypothetical protein